MAGNSNLHDSFRNKQDEFYTQLPMIENELKYYTKHFKDKIVFCNCDDPYESSFFKYFALNFNRLGIKKLLSTGYVTSQIIGTELNLFSDDNEFFPARTTYATYINDISDLNNDGRIDLEDVKLLLSGKHNCRRKIYGDDKYPAGDFRSEESIKLLKQADIVVTNPPFSLFREYVLLLMEMKKDFLIIGNMNNAAYKEILPLFLGGKLWLGRNSGHYWFKVPSDYEEKKTDYKQDEDGQKWRRMGNICWFTTLDYPERHEDLLLYKHYTPEEYPRYDDYDAIDVRQTKDIPNDYYGIMGVPITFLGKWNPSQFAILGSSRYHDGQDFANDINFINGKCKFTRILIKRR